MKNKNVKKILNEVFGSSDFYRDMSFLIPQILNYYDVLDNAQSVIPYATVGIIFDGTKLVKNVADIINNKDNIKKLNKIKRNFDSEVSLVEAMEEIEKKNRNRVFKEVTLSFISSIGDILCFVFLTWIYGETVKVFAQVVDVCIKFINHLKQKGRNNAKRKGGFYAKIFDMEKSTDNKINKKREIMRLLDNEFLDYLNILDYNLKNKMLKKLNLYVKILNRDRRSFGVKKEWNEFLTKCLRDYGSSSVRMETEVFGGGNVPFIESFVDVWQFQRFLLMLEFTNEIKRSINNISDGYTLKERLINIKEDLECDKVIAVPHELELVKFLIDHNNKKLENLTYFIMILGSSIVGEAGEFAAYFKDTVFEVVGLFIKFSGVVLKKGLCMNEEFYSKRKTKKIENHAKSILSIVEIVESLSLDCQKFYQYMGRLKVYIKEIDVKWSDIARENDTKLREDILISALIN